MVDAVDARMLFDAVNHVQTVLRDKRKIEYKRSANAYAG